MYHVPMAVIRIGTLLVDEIGGELCFYLRGYQIGEEVRRLTQPAWILNLLLRYSSLSEAAATFNLEDSIIAIYGVVFPDPGLFFSLLLSSVLCSARPVRTSRYHPYIVRSEWCFNHKHFFWNKTRRFHAHTLYLSRLASIRRKFAGLTESHSGTLLPFSRVPKPKFRGFFAASPVLDHHTTGY